MRWLLALILVAAVLCAGPQGTKDVLSELTKLDWSHPFWFAASEDEFVPGTCVDEAQTAVQMTVLRNGGADERTILKSYGALVLMVHPGNEGSKMWLLETVRLIYGEGAKWSPDQIQQAAYRSCLRITREQSR